MGEAEETLAAFIDYRRAKGIDCSRFQRDLERCEERVCRFSGSGRLVPEFSGSPLREFALPPLRFFYLVDSAAGLIKIQHLLGRQRSHRALDSGAMTRAGGPAASPSGILPLTDGTSPSS